MDRVDPIGYLPSRRLGWRRHLWRMVRDVGKWLKGLVWD